MDFCKGCGKLTAAEVCGECGTVQPTAQAAPEAPERVAEPSAGDPSSGGAKDLDDLFGKLQTIPADVPKWSGFGGDGPIYDDNYDPENPPPRPDPEEEINPK